MVRTLKHKPWKHFVIIKTGSQTFLVFPHVCVQVFSIHIWKNQEFGMHCSTINIIINIGKMDKYLCEQL